MTPEEMDEFLNNIIDSAINKLYAADWRINGFITIYFALDNNTFISLMAALISRGKNTRFNDLGIKSFLLSKLEDHKL